jgi:serpin B
MATGASDFAGSSNRFGLDIFRLLARAPGNSVFSPASLSTALAMAWAGARGETAAQMAAALHLDGAPDAVAVAAGQSAQAAVRDAAPSVLHIANRLFGARRYPFERAFLELCTIAFGAALEPVDFADAEAARLRINAWVEDQTRNRIRDVLAAGSLKPTTRLVLVNALYLLGRWTHPFELRGTRDDMFSISPHDRKPVPTMHRTGHVGFARGHGFSAIELPYEGENLSMIVALPDQVDGLGALEQSLTTAGLDALFTSLQGREVAIALPRFEVSPPGVGLQSLLTELGMSLPFEPDGADFRGIADVPDDRLSIAEVFHKAFVRTNEAGTEGAAAASVVMLGRGPPPPKPIAFTADHPFLFFVIHRPTRLVLFLGRVVDPSANT